MEKNSTRVKLYGVILGIVTAILQHGVYLGANALAGLVGVTPFLPKTPLDDLIPILPIFILPYVWSYLFWAMAPMAASKCEIRHFKNYMASYLFACLFGALILIFAPTYMDRTAEGLMDLPNRGLYGLLRFWYSLDGGEMAYNLFPSFHCINSTISFLAVYKRPEVPKWFRVYSFITLVLICFSTVFVKQHYLPDVFAGIAIAIAAYAVCTKFDLGRIFDRPVAFFKRIFAKKAS